MYVHMKRPIVIAEIGENFIGDLDIARRLIEQAAAAGADFAKFQSYRPETFDKSDPEYDWFCKVSLSDDDHRMLAAHAQKHGIAFMSSPFSLERARFLCEGMGCKEIKIASGMMMNFPLLDYVNEHAQTVFLSTGMATIEEIREALAHLSKVPKVYILHCVTQYPCADADANLSAINTLQRTFPEHEIGYSDHTEGVLAPVIAHAMGARVIEKHFTFDKNATEGTDHILSALPEELGQMITDMRRVEQMYGSGEKAPRKSEQAIIDFVRNRFLEV